ncbi:MAG: cupredoxin domain-containing protein [Actinomycetota bacterium]|nr:cupredoxin domain-containing protein [Actinomycetota bacterium]
MKRVWLFCSALCLIAAVATGCGQSATTEEDTTGTATATSTTAEEPTTTTGESPAAHAATITIADMSFGDPITVAPGTQITVKNNDSVEHSVTSRSADTFDVHVDGGEQGTLTAPTEPGEYAFYCVYHPSMTGTLIVK